MDRDAGSSAAVQTLGTPPLFRATGQSLNMECPEPQTRPGRRACFISHDPCTRERFKVGGLHFDESQVHFNWQVRGEARGLPRWISRVPSHLSHLVQTQRLAFGARSSPHT